MRALRAGLIAALIGVLSPPASAQNPTEGQPDAIDVRALESDLADALYARDRPRLESLLSGDFVLRGAPDIDRQTWIEQAVMRCWGDRSDFDDIQAQRHEDLVIASFQLTIYVDPGTCRAATLRSLVTDVWIREAGEWKLTLRHAGAPPASPGDIAAQYGVVGDPLPPWEASSEFSTVATGGNTSTRSLGLGARLEHRGDGRKTELSTRFLTSQADDVTNARVLTVDGRHGVTLTDRFQMFGEGSYTRDRFAGIDNRVTGNAGVAYTMSFPRAQSLSLEGGLGWTVEQRLDVSTLRFASATGALDYRWMVVPGTELREDVAFNADLESADNWRIANVAAISVAITTILSFRASHGFEYRHTPVAGFKRSDMRTSAALVLTVTGRPGVR